MKPSWLNFPPPLRISIPLLVLAFSLVFDVINTLVLMDGEVARAYDMVEERSKAHAERLANAVVFDHETKAHGKIIQWDFQQLLNQNNDVNWAAVIDQADEHRIIYSTKPEWIGKTMKEANMLEFAILVVDQTVREPAIRHFKDKVIEKSTIAFAPVPFPGGSSMVTVVSRDYWKHIHQETIESIWEGLHTAVVHLIACAGLWWVLHIFLSKRLNHLRDSIRDIGQRLVVPSVLKGADEYAQISRLLWERESISQQLVDNIRDVIYLVSGEKGNVQLLYLSPSFTDIWGFPTPPRGSSTDVLMKYVFEEDKARLRNMLQPLYNGRSAVRCEYRIHRPDGAVRWLESRAFPIRNEQGDILRITGLMADITERKQLEQQVLDISERERHRIGYDLHDDLCQRLAAIKLSSEMVESMIDSGKIEKARSTAANISKHIGTAATLCRSLARGLSPVNMDGGGFSYALQKLVDTTGQLYTNIECQFECDEPITISNTTTATHLYRITQELINNAARHAKPENITVTLRNKDEDHIKLSVMNDGADFIEKTPEDDQKGGMGLNIIRYRAGAIDASVEFLKRPDKNPGTMVVCTIPVLMCQRPISGVR